MLTRRAGVALPRGNPSPSFPPPLLVRGSAIKQNTMNKKPILQEKFYKSTAPKGKHTVNVWESEKQPGKFSFACTYGGGVMRSCGYENDSDYTFGQFDTAEEALEAGRKVIFD